MSSEKSINQTKSESINQISYENAAKSAVESSLKSAADQVASMIKNESFSSSEESIGVCSLHEKDCSNSSKSQHVCRCSQLKVLREKAQKQVNVYKREKAYIHSLRETLDEKMRNKSIKAYLDEKPEDKESSSSFMDCTESCISHKKPHQCSEKKKEKLLQKSNISAQTREEPIHADDEDSEIKELARSSTRKSSKKPSMVIENASTSDEEFQTKELKSRGTTKKEAELSRLTEAKSMKLEEDGNEIKQSINKNAMFDDEEYLTKNSQKGRAQTDEIVRKTTVKERSKTSASDGQLLEELAKSTKPKTQSEAIFRTSDLIDEDEARKFLRVYKRTVKKSAISKSRAECSEDEEEEPYKSKTYKETQSTRQTSQKSAQVEKDETSDDEQSKKSSHDTLAKTQIVSNDEEEIVNDEQSRVASIKSKAKTIASKAASVRQTQLKSAAISKIKSSTSENEEEESIEDLDRQSTRARENFKKKSEQQSQRKSSASIQFEEEMKSASKKSSVRSRPPTPLSSRHPSLESATLSDDSVQSDNEQNISSIKQSIGKSIKSIAQEKEEKLSRALAKSRKQTQATEELDVSDEKSEVESRKSRALSKNLESPRRTSIKLKAFTLVHNDDKTLVDFDGMKIRATTIVSESKSKSVRQTKKLESDDVSSQILSSSQDTIESENKSDSAKSFKSKTQTIASTKTIKENEQRKTSMKTVQKISDDESTEFENESNSSVASQSIETKSEVSKKYEKTIRETSAKSRLQTLLTSAETESSSAIIRATKGKSEVSNKYNQSIRKTKLIEGSDDESSQKLIVKTNYNDESGEEIEFEISLKMSAKAFTPEELKSIRPTSAYSKTSENDEYEMRQKSIKSRPKTAQAELESSRDTVKTKAQTIVKQDSDDEINDAKSRAATIRSKAKSGVSKKYERQTTTTTKSRAHTQKPEQSGITESITSSAVLDSDDELVDDLQSHTGYSMKEEVKSIRAKSERKKTTVDEVPENKSVHICTCALKYPELFKNLEKMSYKCEAFNEMPK
ncbi:hypothetical protein PVAND_003520 [Polypedilum vanderplanki]|uniref:Uncharacterized protein n=1 Tax=Polypedilum vanderplanki TaxID=319348 RepID=A0A9J6BVC2_POLVA|nr:hypothetical protein PVAND_003520 [Polypedilum vanderplanki]